MVHTLIIFRKALCSVPLFAAVPLLTAYPNVFSKCGFSSGDVSLTRQSNTELPLLKDQPDCIQSVVSHGYSPHLIINALGLEKLVSQQGWSQTRVLVN